MTESEYVGSRVPLTSTHCQEGDEVNGMSWYLFKTGYTGF